MAELCFQWFFILCFHEKFILKRDLEEVLFDEGRFYSDKFERTPGNAFPFSNTDFVGCRNYFSLFLGSRF